MEQITFKVKLISNADVDFEVGVPAGATVQVLIDEVRRAKEVPAHRWVRVICAGKELFWDDPVAKATGRVLHCTLCDAQPQRPLPQPKMMAPLPAQPMEPPPPPPVDWLDVVDPGTVLMWIFGSILALLWLLFMFYAHMFDRTSIVMLCMMTVAFLIPCALSYVPWPFLQPQPSARPSPPHADPATGRSSAVPNASAAQRHAYAGDIPPRPAARVGPGS